MAIHLIAAVARNNVIGRDGGLPWHLPADLKHFRRKTTGHTVVMGRLTFESVGKPLPNRRNIVVSTKMASPPAGVELVPTLEDALTLASSDDECFIVGGSRIYADALPYANILDLTKIEAEVQGNVFFPEVDWSQWDLREEVRDTDPASGMSFRFCTYHRIGLPRSLGGRL
jgi:dihydrofolate reductase